MEINIKSVLLILITSMLFQFCKNRSAEDYSGNYIGDIRGQKLSMLLKSEENSKISGTIFDRKINFKINGEVKNGKLTGVALDTIKKLEFEFDTEWNKDTLVWMMKLIKPQSAPAFPIKFIKVFINKEDKKTISEKPDPINKTLSETEVPDISETKAVQNNSEIYDPVIFGFWQVLLTNKMEGSTVFEKNKYLFFNANGSMSVLDKTLRPLEGYKWYTVTDTLFMTSKIEGRISNNNLGRYSIKSEVLTLEKNGKKIELKKMK